MKKSLFILSQHLLPQHLLSRCLGRLARSQRPWLKNRLIRAFIHRYQVNMAEARLVNPEDFTCFNDFFTRELKPGARPLAQDPDSLVCPADGVVSAAGPIRAGQIFQAKGHDYSVEALLGGSQPLADLFQDGHFATIYLSPKDYHRVHMPLTGTLQQMTFVPGRLFSVNQTTAERVPGLFARNERLVCLFDTEAGPMAMVLVGAMVVASMETVWAGTVAPGGRELVSVDYRGGQPAITLQKGEEMGRFLLGSTVILLFGREAVSWQDRLSTGSPVRMGETIGNRQV